MANYIDPLANAELQRTLAFARARETYPGLRGELLLEICEAAWERSAGDPSDGGALARFENALDLIARQYRIGGGRLSVSEVAQTAIPATALNPYLRAGAKRIAEDARAAENAAAVPVNPTFGDRLSRVPRLAPAPLGIGLAASVFGVAAAAQAGVLPDTPITPSHHGAVQTDSSSSATAKKSGGNPAPIAPAATSPGPDSFLAASHAASQAAPGEWQAPERGDGATNAVAARSSLASPGAVSAPADVTAVPAATSAVQAGGAAAPASYSAAPVAAVPEQVQAQTPPPARHEHPTITIDLNGGGVQVNNAQDQGQHDDAGQDNGDQNHDGSDDQGQPSQTPDNMYGVVMVTDPQTGQKHPVVTVNGVAQTVDGVTDGLTGHDGDGDQTGESTDGTTGGEPTEPAGVDDETTDDGSTDPIGDNEGDEETGDPVGTDETPVPDDGTNEGQGTPAETPDTPAPTTPAPATPAPATPAPAPATPPPATPAPATPAPAPAPAPATPAPAPAAPAPATPAPAPATPAPATPAPATPAPAAPAQAAATTPAPTPAPGA